MFETFVEKPNDGCVGAIVLLPGRGQSARNILAKYIHYSNLNQFALIAIEPNVEWYPAPNGAGDQDNSLFGLKSSVPKLDNFISEIENKFEIDRSEIVLSGFSAGAVMAIQIAAYAKQPFKAVISHNGAILEPKDLPKSIYSTKHLVFHNEDDDCFSWEERYIPMKNILIENGYNLETAENEFGGHILNSDDVNYAGIWIKKLFNL